MRNGHKEHIETRNKLKEISTYKTFNQIMDEIILTEDERKLMKMFYMDGKSFACIADELGISEITAKRKHLKILKKIGKIIL